MDEARKSERAQISREIAQVRESLTKSSDNTFRIQDQNNKKLEEVSKLDSEITSLYARLAVSEQRLAETFEQKRQAKELREQKQDLDAKKLSQLREDLREKEEALQQVVIPEVCQVEVQTEAKARLSEMRALESKESAQKSLAETSRYRLSKLKDEISKEQQRQEDLHRSIRKAVEDRRSASENQKAIEVAIMQKGGDPSANPGDVKEAERETQELRSELASEEEKCEQLRKKLKKGDEETQKLQLALDNARGDLERSFKQERAETTALEGKVNAERQRLHLETVTIDNCRQRVEQLRQTLLKLKTAASSPSSRGSPVSNLLTDEIQRTQQQAVMAAKQAQERSAELLRLTQQKLEVKVQAENEARQVKAKIQEIWQSLALAAAAR